MISLPQEWLPLLPALDKLDTAIWVFDMRSQRMEWANRAGLQLWDAPDLEALQQRDMTMSSDGIRQRLGLSRLKLNRGEAVRDLWTIYPRGRAIAVSCVFSLLDRSMPDVIKVEALEVDIEADTLRSLEMLRHVRDMVSLYDMEGRVLLRNPAARLGLPDCDDAFAASLVEGAQADELRLGVSESRVVRRIVDVRLADGAQSRHQIQLVGILDPVTGESALLACQHDVGDRERLLQLQRERSEELQGILDALPLAMVIAELDGGRIRYANRVAIENYGMWLGSAAELNPLSSSLYVHADDRKRFIETLQGMGTVSGMQSQLRDRSGRIFEASMTGNLVDYRGVPAVLVSILDISSIRERERTLEESLQREHDLLEMQRRFVSMVSHEYRTPLAVIDGIAQRMLRQPEQFAGEALLTRAQRVRDMVRHMISLADSVLTLGRLDDGGVALQCEPVRLLPVLTELVELNQGLYPDCQIELDVDAKVPLVVDGDVELLRLVFGNLINNAIKYSPRWQRVAIDCCIQDTAAQITVRDWGLGVPEAEQALLFTRFFRASNAKGIPGTGIGLALVKELLLRHQGGISLQSREGDGAAFTVTLPLSSGV